MILPKPEFCVAEQDYSCRECGRVIEEGSEFWFHSAEMDQGECCACHQLVIRTVPRKSPNGAEE